MIQYLQRVLIVAIPAVIVYLSFTPYRMKALSAMRLRTSRKREVGLVLFVIAIFGILALTLWPTFIWEDSPGLWGDLRILIDGVEASSTAFTEYRVEARNPIPLIYQSGYLTIKEYDKRFKMYRLAFPNDEVKYGFMNFILPFYTPIPDGERRFYIGKFIKELQAGDVSAFLTRLQSFFADFPYELNENKERHYQVVFYLVFKLMGQFTEAEVRSARGRADAVVKTPDQIYVFEFKLNGTAEQALQQIDDRGYLIPYLADGREIVKVGVEFSAETRNISRWLVE